MVNVRGFPEGSVVLLHSCVMPLGNDGSVLFLFTMAASWYGGKNTQMYSRLSLLLAENTRSHWTDSRLFLVFVLVTVVENISTFTHPLYHNSSKQNFILLVLSILCQFIVLLQYILEAKCYSFYSTTFTWIVELPCKFRPYI